MGNARPFWTCTLQEISIDIKNAPRRGDLTPQIVFWVFRNHGGLHFPTFGSVSCLLTFSPKVGLRHPKPKPRASVNWPLVVCVKLKMLWIFCKTRGVSHCGLAIYIKKHFKELLLLLWKLKYFTMQKYNLQKIFENKSKWVIPNLATMKSWKNERLLLQMSERYKFVNSFSFVWKKKWKCLRYNK